MGWDISVSERIYHKLANELLFKIINRTIPMGSKLSPASALVRKASTSQDTMRKALCVLIEHRVISKTYRGYFVTDDRQIICDARQQYIKQETARYQAALLKVNCKAEIKLKALGG